MRKKIVCSDKIRRRSIRVQGFTLIEVIVVLFILLALMAVAVRSYWGIQEKAQRDSTQLYVNALADAVRYYQVTVGRFPTTEQGLNALLNPPDDLPDPAKWAGPYLKDNVQTHDPWGNPYKYVSPGTRTREGFDVWSLGPDGIDGTEDDIGNWTK